MERVGHVPRSDGLASRKPEMISAVWSGLTVVWRRAPFTPEPIRMPRLGASVAFVGDEGSRSRLGLGTVKVKPLRPCTVFVYADSDFYWEENTTPYAGVALRFDETLLARFADQLELECRPSGLRSILFTSDEQLIGITGLMAAELRSPAPGGRLYQDGLATVAMVHLLRRYADARSQPTRATGLTSAKLALLTDYVAEHLDEPIALGDLAGLVGLSPFHFARCFREATGKPPHRFVTDERMTRAKALLAGTRMSIAEIAWQVGYANPGHFATQFKRSCGLTPGRFRTHS